VGKVESLSWAARTRRCQYTPRIFDVPHRIDCYRQLPKATRVVAMSEAKVTADAPFASVEKDKAARMTAKTAAGSGC
jgi:hypothetical protein